MSVMFETVEDLKATVRQAVKDAQAGRTRPLADVLADISRSSSR